MTKTLLIKHPACSLVGLGDLNVPFKGLSTAGSHMVKWRHLVWLMCCHIYAFSSSLVFNLLLNLSCQGGCSLKLSHLLMDIVSIVSGHLHTLVEVIKCWVTHFQCFCWDSWDTSEVSSITLVLEDCFLSQFNPVLFLKLLDKRLEEFLLSLEFLDLGLNLKRDILFDLSFVHSVTCNLWI